GTEIPARVTHIPRRSRIATAGVLVNNFGTSSHGNSLHTVLVNGDESVAESRFRVDGSRTATVGSLTPMEFLA
ncbi:MAG: hypothetical protein ACOC0O_00110, partial [Spirochaetota bacterium]